MYVTDVIKKDYISWKVGDCIFLEAPTGAGKTTFIVRKLLPYAKTINAEILYLSNRFLLKEQIKKEIAEEQGLPTELTWLEDVEEFDGITVMSYQKLQLLCEQGSGVWEINRRYLYIVCDEIHYLLEDSAFNPNIVWLVEFLKEVSGCLICISATLGELKAWISLQKYNINTRFWDWVKKDEYLEYLMIPRLYTTAILGCCAFIYAYNIPAQPVVEKITYYEEQEQIIEMIEKSNKDEKWLIFQSNKRKASELTKKLGESVVLITADDRESDTIAEIIQKSRFSCKVLVATKLLDNGVSLKDSKLRNVVIDTISSTEFLQMLGRKRRIDDNDMVMLYIPKKSKRRFQGYLLPEMQEIYSLAENDFSSDEIIARMMNDEKFYLKARRFFTLENGRFVKNPLAAEYFRKQRKFVEKMLAEFETDEFAFVKEQLAWIGMEDTFDVKNSYLVQQQRETMSHICEVLTQLVDRLLCPSKQEKLREFLTEEIQKVNLKKQKGNRLLGKKAINELLKEYNIPFSIEGIYGKKKGDETFWTVKKREE